MRPVTDLAAHTDEAATSTYMASTDGVAIVLDFRGVGLAVLTRFAAQCTARCTVGGAV